MNKLYSVEMSEGWWLVLMKACETVAAELSVKQELTTIEEAIIATLVVMHDEIAKTIGATDQRFSQSTREIAVQVVKKAMKGDYVN